MQCVFLDSNLDQKGQKGEIIGTVNKISYNEVLSWMLALY